MKGDKNDIVRPTDRPTDRHASVLAGHTGSSLISVVVVVVVVCVTQRSLNLKKESVYSAQVYVRIARLITRTVENCRRVVPFECVLPR